jgi:opacity protein-like surface antigen
MVAGMNAQEFSHFAFKFGAGFTQALGQTGTRLDLGYNARLGAGVKFNPWVDLMVNGAYDNMGINPTTLASFGAPGGRMSVWSFTLDPVVHLNPKGHVDFYVTGGGGLFHRYQEFTAPSVSTFTAFDPFFGFYTAGVPSNQILGSYSVNKPGIDIGAGVAFGSKWHGKFFAEARYNRIFMGNRFNNDTEYLPVTFGFRW